MRRVERESGWSGWPIEREKSRVVLTSRTQIDRLREQVGDLLAARSMGVDLDVFEKFERRPVEFIQDVLGGDRIWSRQLEIAESVRDGRFTVVRSCNSAGKDWVAAHLALWWCYARRGLVLITGPTERQVREIVMGEVARAFRRNDDLPGELYQRSLRIPADENLGILAFTPTEASKLTGKIRKGEAKFEELARIHSHDSSADKGGDLGFIHEGMLGTNAEDALNKLAIGEVSDAVQILEGYAVFRLNKINEPALSPYETVRVRAKQLWKRDRVAAAKADLRATLLADASVEIHDAQFKEWWQAKEGRQSKAASSEPASASADGR